MIEVQDRNFKYRHEVDNIDNQIYLNNNNRGLMYFTFLSKNVYT